MYNWTDNDNIIAYYLYRFPHLRNSRSIEVISERLGMSKGSMSLKIGNFEYLDTDGKSGMSGYSVQSERIYKKYKDMPDSEFSLLVEKLLPAKETALLSPIDKLSA